MTDYIKRADAIEAVTKLCVDGYKAKVDGYFIPLTDALINTLSALPSADAEKKKAELKENGDWDCPDVGCDECDHHRSVEWCSLAIPNHEEIDETYKMVNEAFFEGFDAAEKRYRFLIETVEELMESADAVTIHEDGTLEIKVPNAQKVGRVLVIDADSHIGGGLFYPDDAEAEPKWNCTANFVAEQLDRLSNMTDEERWDFFIKFFSPSAEQVTSKLNNPCDSLLTDDSAECKEQKSKLESADAVSREVKEDDKFNTCNNHSNNADADYKPHIKGEWEHWGSPFSDESEVIDTIVCSVCGARFIEPKDEPKGEYNYCPNCGARMKGGDE